MVENKSLILAKHPVALPIVGEDLVVRSEPFDLDQAPPEGGVILKTNYISYDPYMRGRMKPSTGLYITGFALNSKLNNNALSTVLSSSTPRFSPGDIVIGASSFSSYVLVPASTASKEASSGGLSLLSNTLSLDPKIFLGALGMPGLTAYSSFFAIARPKIGEVIFISAASGAVGQIVGQLAKREGMLVIGSVGSKAKLDFIKGELGFDGGFNYKEGAIEGSLRRVLGELGREGVDVYYDNVGGEQLDVALVLMNTRGRVVSCGSVSQTSKKPEDRYRIANMPLVVGKRITIRGFIVIDEDMGPKYTKEHQENMQKWIKSGEIKVQMSVTDGIDKSAEGLVGMLKGENFGKAVLKIADF